MALTELEKRRIANPIKEAEKRLKTELRALVRALRNEMRDGFSRIERNLKRAIAAAEDLQESDDPLIEYRLADVRACRPDQAAIRRGDKPIQPRCELCRRLIKWGEEYRAVSRSARARGVGVHEVCLKAAKKKE